jgi:hypothetical protein
MLLSLLLLLLGHAGAAVPEALPTRLSLLSSCKFGAAAAAAGLTALCRAAKPLQKSTSG